MKTFVTIYKFVLLWTTFFSFIFFIMGLESMIMESRWSLILTWILMNGIFYWLCHTLLTKRDFLKLSGNYYFKKYLK